MQPPNIENLFIACVPKFYFDDGNGERDLGLVEKPPSVELKSTEVKVYNSQDGKRRLKKLFSTEEELTLDMVLQEAVAANVQAFFKGGALETVGAGTAALVDQALTLTGEVPASLAKYGISAVTVRQFLDKVFMYDGAAYTDHTAEADALAGTPFETLADADSLLYLGKTTPFQEAYFDFAVPGEYGAAVVKYWNGAAWTAVADLAGAAAALAADGKMNWTLPTDWAITTVNGYSGYFLQISATTPWTTPATVNHIRQNAVQNTDYIVDPGQVTPELLVGRIGRLAAGFLADGEQVKVSFTHTTWTSLRFPVATENFIEGAARLAFRPTDGFWWNFIIPRCQLKPNGKVTFDDKNPMELPMLLSVLDDSENNPTYPYGYWECLNET
jgi:hypothetical protein